MKRAITSIDHIVCPRNMLLKLRVEDYLKANGWSIVPASEYAQSDLILFFSCGVRGIEAEQGLNYIRSVNEQISRLPNPPTFVVSGCLTAITKRELSRIHNGPTIGHRDLEKLDELINASVRIEEIPWRNEVKDSERVMVAIDRKRYVPVLRVLKKVSSFNGRILQNYKRVFHRYLPNTFRTSQYFDRLQMGDQSWCVLTSVGCLGKCSYCSIRFAKGRLKSRPLDQVLQEVRRGVENGYKWVSLLADDNGVYGRDIGTTFGKLLQEVNKIKGNFKILLDSVSPDHFIEFYDEILECFQSGKLEYMVLAVQHVNPRVLAAMNRPYDVDRFKKYLENVSRKYPSFRLDVHLIYCFPGETEEEFEELLSFVKWLIDLNPRNEYKINLYSPANDKVPSAKLEPLPKETVEDRIQRVSSLLREEIKRKEMDTMPRSMISKVLYFGLMALERGNRFIWDTEEKLRVKQHCPSNKSLEG